MINPSSLSGLWYNPQQAGQGFTFSFDVQGRIAVTWYVYDNAGNQVWLIGSGELVGNTAVLPVVITSGGLFPPLFQPSQVTRTPWGTLTLNVIDCGRINAAWSATVPGFSSGNFDVVPLIVSGGLTCQVTQLDDVGNSCGEARPLLPNGSFNGSIDPASDADYFRVELPSGGLLRARSVRQGALDPVGAILDGNCDVILEGDDSVTDQNFDIDTLLAAGTYFVRVASFGGGSSGNYALNLTFNAGATDDFPDSCAAAGTVSANGSLIGRIDETSDSDFVRIVIGERGIFEASSSGTATLDPVGAVLDSNCETIAENDDSNGQNFFIRISLEPGTYYVKVRSYASASSGPYTLTLGFSPGTGPADDHGNICGSATAIAANTSASGNIEINGDDDYFRFQLPSRGTLTVVTSDTTSLDPEIAIFDTGCDRLGEDDDGGVQRNSALTIPVGAGTYYVRVRAFQASSLGAYTVQPRFVASVPGIDDHGNNCAGATPLAPSYAAIGRLEPASDLDFFRFELEVDGTFTVESTDNNTLDPIGALLDANCQVIAQNDDSNGANFSVSAPVTTGVYYLRVGSANGTSSDDYQLNFGYTGFAAPPAASAVAKSGAAPKAPGLHMRSTLARAWGEKPRKAATPKAVVNASALTGLWYDPAGDGQGFSLSFNQSGTVAIAWYVYSNTRQAWLVGSGDVVGNRAVVQAFIARGARFPPNFNPADVTLTPWGTITLDIRSCNDIRVSWASTLPGFSTGSLNAIPLIVAGGLTCNVTPVGDDVGNTCATAASATLNASTSGRIDPANDEDYFRFTVGSAGTFSVQSGGSTTLNPRGALLDASCAVLAQNDDASGREFSLSRQIAAGTYYVRVASSASASVGDYNFASTFASTPGGSTSLSLLLENQLLYDLDFRVNGGEPIRVSAGTSLTQATTVSGSLGVSFALVGAVNQAGAPAGDLFGGSFDPIASPAGTIRFTVDNQIGTQTYFAPVIGNKSSSPLLVGVNMGTPDENRCNCIVPANARDARVGYYRLGAASNVRGYTGASAYSGPYVVWGSDPSLAGRQLLAVPLNSVVQSPSGRTTLQTVSVFPQ